MFKDLYEKNKLIFFSSWYNKDSIAMEEIL